MGQEKGGCNQEEEASEVMYSRNESAVAKNIANAASEQVLVPRISTAKSDKQPGHHTISVPKIGSGLENDSNAFAENRASAMDRQSRVKSHRVVNESAPRLPSAAAENRRAVAARQSNSDSHQPDLLFLPRDSAHASIHDDQNRPQGLSEASGDEEDDGCVEMPDIEEIEEVVSVT